MYAGVLSGHSECDRQQVASAGCLMSTGEIANPEAPAAEQRYVMKSVRQESGTLLPTLGITFEY